MGVSGWGTEGGYVWGIWCRNSKVTSSTDVTAEVIPKRG